MRRFLGQRKRTSLLTVTAVARGSAFHCAGSLCPNRHVVVVKRPGDTCTLTELHYRRGTQGLGNLNLNYTGQ